MKLGSQTVSMTNFAMSGTLGQPEPVVGMGATVLLYSDRHAGTIVKVETWRKGVLLHVQRDITKRTDKNGFSECQEYEYTQDPNGLIDLFWMGKDSKTWREVRVECGKRRLCPKGSGFGLHIGDRDEYYDFTR